MLKLFSEMDHGLLIGTFSSSNVFLEKSNPLISTCLEFCFELGLTIFLSNFDQKPWQGNLVELLGPSKNQPRKRDIGLGDLSDLRFL